MTFSDLSAQPSKPRIEQERIAKESTQLEFSTVDFRFRDITHTALEHLGVCCLVLQVLVVVEEGRRVQTDTTTVEISLETYFVGINGFLLERWQHNDGRYNAFTTVGQV